MSNLTGNGLAEFAKSKLGTPYVYGAKGANGEFTQDKLDYLAKAYGDIFTSSYRDKAKKLIGKVCCDCSGLISWYTGKVLGSAQLHSTASKRGLIIDISMAPIGAILWHVGHVGIYIGDGYCIEEKGIDYGCVKSKISDTHFTHWLIFSYIDYELIDRVVTTKRGINPYVEPTTIVVFSDLGTSVRWVQWELKEAGYPVKIDGNFGSITSKYVKEFQKSCKIKVDGEVGQKTITAFKAN